MPGVFAAGDVRHGSGNRIAAAVGEGAMAVRFAHQRLGGDVRDDHTDGLQLAQSERGQRHDVDGRRRDRNPRVVERRAPVFFVVRIGIGVGCPAGDFRRPGRLHVAVFSVQAGEQFRRNLRAFARCELERFLQESLSVPGPASS